MRKILVIMFILPLSYCMHAQGLAGEDKETCGGMVILGVPNPDPDHCYIWRVGKGLTEDYRHSPNPHVYAIEDATYRVTVTDQDFSFRTYDEVDVKVTLGYIDFEPEYVSLEEDAPPVQATLVPIDGMERIVIWSISACEGACDCDITADGIISGCSSEGKITVKAIDANNMNCSIEKDIYVNTGVKEVKMYEGTKPNRVASSIADDNGYILYVTDVDPVIVKALANDGTDFAEGQPVWEGDPMPDQDGIDEWAFSDNAVSVGNSYTITAGDQTVVLVYKDEDDVPAYEFSPNLSSSLIDIVGPFTTSLFALGPFLSEGPCTCAPDATYPFVHPSVTRKWVERNKDPGLGRFINVSMDASTFFKMEFGGGTNCAYLQRFGHNLTFPNTPGNVFIAPFLVFGNGDQEIKFETDVIFDASHAQFEVETPGTGIISTTSIVSGEITYAAGFAVVQSLTDGPFGLETSNLTPQSTFTVRDGTIQMGPFVSQVTVDYDHEWGGLQLDRTGNKLYYGSPSNPTWTKTGRGALNLLDGGSGTVTLPVMREDLFNFE